MSRFAPFTGFCVRVLTAHVLTYFFIGFFFFVTGLNVLAYYELHPDPLVAAFFRPSTSILVRSGTLFQLIRGMIFGVVLYPFKSVFTDRKLGWLYLWGLFLSLAILCTSSSAPGSLEGVVYTNFSISFHLIYLPEVIIQTLAFAGLVVFWERHQVKKVTYPLLIIFLLIVLISLPALFQ